MTQAFGSERNSRARFRSGTATNSIGAAAPGDGFGRRSFLFGLTSLPLRPAVLAKINASPLLVSPFVF